MLFFAVIITFGILKFFNTPYNIYSVLISNYEKRMVHAYGDCKNESWGFYKKVIKKFNLKNEDIKIFNDEGSVTLENIFNLKISNKVNPKYLLILNYQSQNNENIYDSKYNFIKKYKTAFRYNNCYLMKLND
jgi:hypothetical protein